MPYDLQSIQDDDGICGYCAGATEREAVERLEVIAAVPVTLRTRMIVTCRQCKRVAVVGLDPTWRTLLKRSRGAYWRIVLTWLWFLGGIIGAVVGADCVRHVDRQLALTPIVGDRWTVETKPWAALTDAEVFENAFEYGVVTIVGVNDEEVEVAACDMTTQKRTDVEERCKSFRIELEPVPRAAIQELLGDAIERVTREGRPFRYWPFGLLAAYLGLLLLHAWRCRRYLAGHRRV